jgi:hypothetical protein
MEKIKNTAAKDLLPQVQQFLLTKKLVPDKNAPFYAYWVWKYFGYARKRQLSAMAKKRNAIFGIRLISQKPYGRQTQKSRN